MPLRSQPAFALVALLTAVALLVSSHALAQDALSGTLGVTYRGDGGNAQAAVVSLADGNLVYDSASIPAEDDALPSLGAYLWHMSQDGSTIVLDRPSLMSITGELVRTELSTVDATVVQAPDGAALVVSKSRLTPSGDRVLFLYRPVDAADPSALAVGQWQGGASTHLAGDGTMGIVAFALSSDGTLAYLALPLDAEGAPAELFVTSIDGGEIRSFGTLPTDAPLAVNPASTSIAISADGSRVSVSAPQRGEVTSPVVYQSFGIDLGSGESVAYAGGENGVRDASVSPDGSSVVLFDPAARQLVIADFMDPASARPLGEPLGVGTDRPVAWSPDGGHIAYGDVGSDGYQAYVRATDGGDATQVTTFEGGLWNSAFSWGE